MEQDSDFEMVSIFQPERYWIVVLGVLDETLQNTVMPRIKELRKSGSKVEELHEGEKAALFGVMAARATILEKLVERGVIREEAEAVAGARHFFEWSMMLVPNPLRTTKNSTNIIYGNVLCSANILPSCAVGVSSSES